MKEKGKKWTSILSNNEEMWHEKWKAVIFASILLKRIVKCKRSHTYILIKIDIREFLTSETFEKFDNNDNTSHLEIKSRLSSLACK